MPTNQLFSIRKQLLSTRFWKYNVCNFREEYFIQRQISIRCDAMWATSSSFKDLDVIKEQKHKKKSKYYFNKAKKLYTLFVSTY